MEAYHGFLQIIARAKAANVSELEKGMPEQPFGDWLESNFAGKAKISWEVNDCGENDGSGHQDELPVCAEADLNFLRVNRLVSRWQWLQ